MSELDILLQARLDTEETKGIISDIKTLSERLKSNPLNLEVSIKDSDLGQLTKQIKQLETDLSKLKNNTSFNDIGKDALGNVQEMKTQFDDLDTQMSKISKTWASKHDREKKALKEIREQITQIGQLQKTTITRDSGGQVKDIKYQEVTNHLQIQKGLYDQIKRLNTDIFNIEKSMVGMKDSDKFELQQQVDTRKKLVNEINNTIQANGLENAKLKEQVALARELQQAKLNVAQGKSTDKDSATAYRQLVNLAKEESTLKSQMLSLEGEQLQIAQNRLNMIHSEQRELERMTNSQSGSLHNKEREAELTKIQNRLLNDQAMTQQKLIDKEKARVEMLGKKMTGGSLQNVDLSDMNQVQQYVQSIMGANVEISKLTEAHSRYGKGVHEVIATQKLSNNTMRQTTLMADSQTGAMYKLGEAITPLPNKLMGIVRQMGEAIIKSAQWAIAMTALYGSLRQLQEGIKIVAELDRELTLVAVTSGKTRQQVQYLGKEYANIAQQTGKTVKEVSQVNTELVRQGLSLEESSKRMQTAMKLSAVGGFDANESLKILTSSVNALGVEADRTADVMLRAGNISASSPEEIGEAFTKTASSAKSAGVELEQLGATLAVLIETTQESPSSLGNSMKTLITRFNKVNEETGELNEDLNQVQTAFESVGIAFTDSEGQIRPMFDLLKDLNEVWGGLDKNTKAYLATQSAGTHQANRFLAIMDNFNRVLEVQDDLMTNSGGELNKAHEEYMNSVEASANKMKASMEEMWINTINSDVLVFFYEFATALIKAVDNIGLINIALFGLYVTFKTFHAHSVATDGALAKFTSRVMTNQNAIKQSITDYGIWNTIIGKTGTTLNQTTASIDKATSSIDKYNASNKTTALAIPPATASMGAMSGATTVLVGGLSKLAGVLKTLAPMLIELMLITTAFDVFTDIVSSFSDSSETASLNIGSITKEISDARSNINSITQMKDEFGKLNEKLGESRDFTRLTTEEQAKYNAMMSKINEFAPEYVMTIDEQGNAMIRYGETLDSIIEKEEELVKKKKEQLIGESEVVEGELEKKRELLKTLQEREKKAKEEYAKSGLVRQETTEGWKPQNILGYGARYFGGTNEVYNGSEATDALNKLQQDIQETSGSIKELQSQELQMLNIYMEEIDGFKNVSSGFKEIMKEEVAKTLEQDGLEEAKKDIEEISSIMNKYGDQIIENGTSYEDVLNNSEKYKKILDELGYSEERQIELLYSLASHLGMVASGYGDVADATMEVDFEGIKKLRDNVVQVEDAYNKLSSNKKLSMDEITSLIQQYDELAQYLAETGDTTFQNGEMLKNLWHERHSDIMQKLQDEKKETENIVASKKKQIEVETKLLEILAFNKNSELYKTKKKELDILIDSLKDAEAQAKKTQNQIDATTKAERQDRTEKQLEFSKQGFEESVNNMEFYNNMIKEYDKNGKFSSDTIREVIRSHDELTHLLGNEGELYNYVSSQIGNLARDRNKHYKNMLMENEAFYNSTLKSNETLFSNLAKVYKLNLNNFTTMGQLMVEVANQSSKAIQQALTFEIKTFTQGTLTGSGSTFDPIFDLKRKISQLEKDKANVPFGILGMADKARIEVELQKTRELLRKAELEKQANSVITSGTSSIISQAVGVGTGYGDIGSATIDKEKEKKEPLKPVKNIDIISSINIYKRWEQALNSVNVALQRHQMMLELSTGDDRVNLLKKEIKLLGDKQKILSQTANEYRREASVMAQRLSKAEINVNDGSMGIATFEAKAKKYQSYLNSLTKQINATQDEKAREQLEEKRSATQESWDRITDDFERYIEAQDNLKDLSTQWWENEFEKFNKTLEQISTGLEKYEKRVTRLNEQLTLRMFNREDNKGDFEYMLQNATDIKDVYVDIRASLNDQIAKNRVLEKSLESQLASSKGNDLAYANIARRLTMVRAEQDLLVEHHKEATLAMAEQVKQITELKINALKREREEFQKTLDEMAKVQFKFDDRELSYGIRKIELELNKLDDIFIDNAKPTLSTGDARKKLDELKEIYADQKAIVDAMKAERDKHTLPNQDWGFGEMNLQKQKEWLEETLKLRTEEVKELTEKQEILSQILEDTKLENQEVEDALANRIELKQEELKALQEQFKQEDKIKATIEKQLNLLKALDDRRYSYISARGEETFTYDMTKVNELRKQLEDDKVTDKRAEAEEKLREQIEKLQEELARTKEINQLAMEGLSLEINTLGQWIGAFTNEITELNQALDKNYENQENDLISNAQESMKPFVDTFDKLWQDFFNRKAIEPFYEMANDIRDAMLGRTYMAHAGETLRSIAKAFGHSLDQLLAMNQGISADKKLSAGTVINRPANSAMNIIPRYDSYDTGGYTGTWGSDGKLAMLHQKEIVLNKADTENLLASVDITREIASKLFSNGLNKDMFKEQINNHTETNQPITIENINLPNVSDGRGFVNELQHLLRGGMKKIY